MIERRTAPFGLALALAGGALLSAGAAVAQGNCVTAECHATLVAGKVRHEAAESCDTCHQAVSDAHPSADGGRSFELTSAPPALCADCHDVAAKSAHVHPPFGRGTCTICHSPHSSNEPKLLRKSPSEICRNCHGDKAAVAFPHGPVSAGECGLCHAAHDSAVPKLLVKSGDALCFDCHSEIQGELGKKSVHGALDGGCTSCHAPHGTDHPKLLAQVGAAVCAECHSEVTDRLATAAAVHAPVADGKGCFNCHAPHAADHAKLLPASVGETCKSCHQGVVTAAMTYEHAPVADGDCAACHDPHAADGKKLLARAFPAGAYAPYDEKKFALCFDCHDAALARFADTEFATGFRDGKKNLHFLHVNDVQKGRSCVLCHAVHGSPNPALIATSVPFGKWTLPLGFVKTENGGTCAPGCHKPLAYDRKAPVAQGAAEAPASTGSR